MVQREVADRFFAAAVDEGLRRGLGARPARGRANRLPSGLAHGLPAAAERRLGARRVPPARAARRLRAREASRDRRVRAPAQAARELARARRRRRRASDAAAGARARSAATPAVRAEELAPPEFVALAEALLDVNRAPATAKLNLALVVGPLARRRPPRGRDGAAADRPRRPRLESSRRPRSRVEGFAEDTLVRAALERARRGRARRPALARADLEAASRSPPASAAAAPTPRPRSGSPTRPSPSRSRRASARARRASSAPTSRSSSPTGPQLGTGTGTELAAARAAAGLLGRPAASARPAQAVDGRRLRRLRPARRRRRLRGTARAPTRAPWPRSKRPRDLAALPPNDLASSPHAERAARARRLPRGRERGRTDGLRALPAPRARQPPPSASSRALGPHLGHGSHLVRLSTMGTNESLEHGSTIEHGTTRRGRWLQRRRIRITLWIAVSRASSSRLAQDFTRGR